MQQLRIVNYMDQFTLHMAQVPGVLSVSSLSALAKFANAGLNEGQSQDDRLPRDSKALQVAIGYLPEAGAVQPRLHHDGGQHLPGRPQGDDDRPAIQAVGISAATTTPPRSASRSGWPPATSACSAATNEKVEERELPMMPMCTPPS